MAYVSSQHQQSLASRPADQCRPADNYPPAKRRSTEGWEQPLVTRDFISDRLLRNSFDFPAKKKAAVKHPAARCAPGAAQQQGSATYQTPAEPLQGAPLPARPSMCCKTTSGRLRALLEPKCCPLKVSSCMASGVWAVSDHEQAGWHLKCTCRSRAETVCSMPGLSA